MRSTTNNTPKEQPPLSTARKSLHTTTKMQQGQSKQVNTFFFKLLNERENLDSLTGTFSANPRVHPPSRELVRVGKVLRLVLPSTQRPPKANQGRPGCSPRLSPPHPAAPTLSGSSCKLVPMMNTSCPNHSEDGSRKSN